MIQGRDRFLSCLFEFLSIFDPLHILHNFLPKYVGVPYLHSSFAFSLPSDQSSPFNFARILLSKTRDDFVLDPRPSQILHICPNADPFFSIVINDGVPIDDLESRLLFVIFIRNRLFFSLFLFVANFIDCRLST